MIRFACPGCGAVYTVGDEKAGKTGKCPKCDSQFVIPMAEGGTAPPPPLSPMPSAYHDPYSPVEIAPCPNCQSRLSVAQSDLGADVECPHCRAIYPAVRVGDKQSIPTAPASRSSIRVDAPSPRSRRHDDDYDRDRNRDRDDDDYRPSRRRAVRDDDDDDDDRPRRSRSRYDDDDDDRPKKRKKSRYRNIESKRVTAAILALLLGGLGVHKFYLGYSTTGTIYILLCCTGISGAFALADAIIYLTKSDEEFIETYQINQKEWF